MGLKPCWGKEHPEAEVLGISKPGEGSRHKGVGNASRGHRFSFLLLLFLWAGVKGRREKSQNMELQREKLFQGKVGNVAVEKQKQEEEKMGQDLGDELSAAKGSSCDRVLPRR